MLYPANCKEKWKTWLNTQGQFGFRTGNSGFSYFKGLSISLDPNCSKLMKPHLPPGATSNMKCRDMTNTPPMKPWT